MKKQISVLFLLRVIKLAVSVLNLSLAAKYFGITLERDVWVLALNGLVVIDMALWGPVNETFRAKFVLLRETAGEQVVLERVKSLLGLIALVTVCITACLVIFPGIITTVAAPGYTGEAKDALATMVRVIAPSLLLNELTLIGISILNAYESFYTPEFSGFIAAVFNLLCLIVLAPVMGIYALVIGYYFGLVLLAVLLIIQLKKKKIPLFSGYGNIRLTGGYPFLRYAMPFFFPYFFIQLNLLIEKSLASLLGNGAVSTLDYARKFVDIPIQVLTSVLLTMLVPVLAGRSARGDHEGFQLEFTKVLRFGLLVVTMLIAFFSSSAYEVVAVMMLNEGQMGASVISKISALSQYYAWSSLISFLYIIFGLALLSAGKGKYYAFFGVVAQLIMIGINFLGYKSWGTYVFPVSFIIAHTAAALFLFAFFPGNKRRLALVILTYSALLAVAVAVVWTVSNFSSMLVSGTGAGNYVIIGIHTLLIVVVMFILLYIFRLEERFIINNVIRRLIPKLR